MKKIIEFNVDTKTIPNEKNGLTRDQLRSVHHSGSQRPAPPLSSVSRAFRPHLQTQPLVQPRPAQTRAGPGPGPAAL